MASHDPSTPSRSTGDGFLDPPIREDGPTLMGVLFLTLWVNTSIMSGVIIHGRAGWPAGIPWILLSSVLLALAATAACRLRRLLHDLLIVLSPREQLVLASGVLALFLLPGLFLPGRILPDGFIWAAPLLLLLSVRPSYTRRFLAWTFLGAWVGGFRIHDTAGMVWMLLFGVSWLTALGATHFAFTGEPHGLAGWWPVRRILRNAWAASVPALATALLAWWVWPEPSLAGRRPAMESPGGGDLIPLAYRMDRIDLLALIWRGAVSVLLLVLLFLFLLYLRRLWLRRRGGDLASDVLPGQVARLEP